MLLQKRYNSSRSSADIGYGITLDNTGNIYITGSSTQTNINMFILKLDANGTKLWETAFNGGTSADYGYDIAVDNSGNVFVTGSGINTSYPDIVVLKLASNGNKLWEKVFDGGASSSDKGEGIVADNTGFIYVTGSVGSDIFTIRMSDTQSTSSSSLGQLSPSFSIANPSLSVSDPGFTNVAPSFSINSSFDFTISTPGFTGFE